jgi:hypothetical protein
MAIEKKWLAVPPRLMTADGSTLGVITIASTSDLRVKMAVVLQATLLPPTRLQIKRVLSPTQFVVGPFPDTNTQGKAGLKTTADCSVYTVAAGSFIYTEEQDKSIPKSDDIDQAVYEQEPVVALRTFPVDEFGRSYNSKNPFPTIPGGSQISPPEFDEVIIVRDTDEYPTQYQFYLNGVQVWHIDVEYDPDKFAIHYKGFKN